VNDSVSRKPSISFSQRYAIPKDEIARRKVDFLKANPDKRNFFQRIVDLFAGISFRSAVDLRTEDRRKSVIGGIVDLYRQDINPKTLDGVEGYLAAIRLVFTRSNTKLANGNRAQQTAYENFMTEVGKALGAGQQDWEKKTAQKAVEDMAVGLGYRKNHGSPMSSQQDSVSVDDDSTEIDENTQIRHEDSEGSVEDGTGSLPAPVDDQPVPVNDQEDGVVPQISVMREQDIADPLLSDNPDNGWTYQQTTRRKTVVVKLSELPPGMLDDEPSLSISTDDETAPLIQDNDVDDTD